VEEAFKTAECRGAVFKYYKAILVSCKGAKPPLKRKNDKIF
jgi:hypothetical protein